MMEASTLEKRESEKKRDTAESFHLRMPAETLRRVKELARRERRTEANVIRILLDEALDAREQGERKAS